jgi:hypothetical protein
MLLHHHKLSYNQKTDVLENNIFPLDWVGPHTIFNVFQKGHKLYRPWKNIKYVLCFI